MLAAAKHYYPNCKIVIKAHAETISGRRPGYFSAADETEDVQIPANVPLAAVLKRKSGLYAFFPNRL